jgi:2-methylcitrate dehydratase PrpD
MKLMGLDVHQSTMALGIAGSQASGLGEFDADGAWTKRFHAGHASMGGILAATLAKNGYTGPKTIFEGRDGFMRAYSFKGQYDFNKITDNLGIKWEVNDVSIKVHACCRFSAPLADCALDLNRQGLKAEEVKKSWPRQTNLPFPIFACLKT